MMMFVETLLAILVAGGFYILTLIIKPENISDINISVFAVSGTIVALILPAAELASHSLRRVTEYWLNRIVKVEVNQRGETAGLGSELIDEAEKKALCTWHGSICMVISLILSSIGLFTPRMMYRGYIIHIDYLLLSGALGFLFIGIFSYLPFVRWIYCFEEVRDAEVVLREIANPPNAKADKK